MAYKALKKMLVGDVEKQPGDMVPEAMEWGSLRAWIAEGYIEEVPDEAPKKTAAKPAAAKPAAKKRTAAKPAVKTASKPRSKKE